MQQGAEDCWTSCGRYDDLKSDQGCRQIYRDLHVVSAKTNEGGIRHGGPTYAAVVLMEVVHRAYRVYVPSQPHHEEQQ